MPEQESYCLPPLTVLTRFNLEIIWNLDGTLGITLIL
jgi:hypothetical protein